MPMASGYVGSWEELEPMPPLEDPDLLAAIKSILSNWHVTDYVTAKDEALEWAGKNLSGFTLKSLAKRVKDACTGSQRHPSTCRQTVSLVLSPVPQERSAAGDDLLPGGKALRGPAYCRGNTESQC